MNPLARALGNHRSRLGVTAAVALALSGCQQPGPFVQRHTMIGALKANVAQLESDKDQLAREANDLKAENRRIAAELAELEDRNGDLAARLDDARAVMSRQGLEERPMEGSRRSASEDGRSTPRRSPARAQPSSGRKTPMAQLPYDRKPVEDEDEDESLDEPAPRSRRDAFSPQARLNDRSPWLPVANGPAANRKVR